MGTLSRDFGRLLKFSVVSLSFDVRLRCGFAVDDGDSGLNTLPSVLTYFITRKINDTVDIIRKK